MSWRGQGGKRAKGRRGDQDPELDNTAWLAELEREAAAKADDDDEDDWASTLRRRRPPTAPSLSPDPPSEPSPEPGWAPPSDHQHQDAEPGGAGSGQEPGAWAADPGLGDTSSAPDPDWSWRPSTADAFEDPGTSTQADPDAGWERYGGAASSEPVPETFGGAPQDAGAGAGWEGSQAGHGGWGDPGDQGARASSADPGTGSDLYEPEAPRYEPEAPRVGGGLHEPADPRAGGNPWDGGDPPAGGDLYGAGDLHAGGDPRAGGDPGAGSDFYGAGDPQAEGGSTGGEEHEGWRSAGVDTPTGTWDPGEPVGREPDYPALFGELYRRSAAQQDPIWEADFDQPMPEQGHTDPSAATWPFEETTQSWEPSDRSFIWPSDELPSTPAEWDQPGSTNWLDDPAPGLAAAPEPDQTAVWPEAGRRAWEEPAPEPAPEPRSSPWGGQPGGGNGVAPPVPPGGPTTPAPPPPAGSMGPPPDDWAAAIPTDVPAARRSADPSATRAWRPDEGADAEPGVPLGPGSRTRAPGPQAPSGERPAGRATRSRGPAGGAPPGAGPAGPGGGAALGAGLAGPAGTGPGAPAAGSPRAPAGRGSGGPAGGTRPPGEARRGQRAPAGDGLGGTTQVANGPLSTRTAPRPGRGSSEMAGEPDVARRGPPIDTAKKGKRSRQGGERQARAWPRVVAVISWIVLVMVLCWYYVFPWLERVLPENF